MTSRLSSLAIVSTAWAVTFLVALTVIGAPRAARQPAATRAVAEYGRVAAPCNVLREDQAPCANMHTPEVPIGALIQPQSGTLDGRRSRTRAGIDAGDTDHIATRPACAVEQRNGVGICAFTPETLRVRILTASAGAHPAPTAGLS